MTLNNVLFKFMKHCVQIYANSGNSCFKFTQNQMFTLKFVLNIIKKYWRKFLQYFINDIISMTSLLTTPSLSSLVVSVNVHNTSLSDSIVWRFASVHPSAGRVLARVRSSCSGPPLSKQWILLEPVPWRRHEAVFPNVRWNVSGWATRLVWSEPAYFENYDID